MSEDQAEYKMSEDAAAIIERPRKAHGIGENNLQEYQLNGWVKMSAKFCKHIKTLRGAKLSIWLCLALSIDENGECHLTQKRLCEMTGYSHTEVIDSVKELDEMGFLSVDRSGKRNLYSPEFVSKGKGNSPTKETLVKKLDSTPADSLESSPSPINSATTSIKKKKESKADPFGFMAKSKELADGQKDDETERIIVELETGLRVNIYRSLANQQAAKRLLKDGRPINMWLNWCKSDEWRLSHLYIYADLEKVWRDFPQAFDNTSNLNRQNLEVGF